jgi:hypothetical protein
MNFQDFRNLQKAYKQVYSSQRLNEFGPGDAGGSLKVGRTFGGAPGTPQNTTLSGSGSLGGLNVSGSLEQGRFSGQGNQTDQSVTNAIKNLENPKSEPLDTNTSTFTTGVRGKLNANFSGDIGSGVTPQDAARKSAMQKQTMLTPAPAPTTPPATKLPQEPAPKTPVAKTPVAILNNPKPPPTPTKLISVAKNMEAILLKKKEDVDVPTISTKSNNARLPGFM